LLGAVLSMSGVLMVISRGDPAVLATLTFVPGDLLMLLAAMTWGFYSWQLARPPAAFTGEHKPTWNWAGMLQAQMAFGILGSAVGTGIEMAVSEATWVWSWQVAAIVAFVALGPSLIAYRCWGLGVATVGPAMAAFFSNLTPVFAALMSAWLLGQPPRWFHVVAFALIVAGIVVSSRRPRART
jgi:drug/metabolite transporter (DMT)-like permease